mmetsp:Transcript_3601/g.10995  ORF Transcript_3601/g.10995 Transcript_3601/m.10995 type:complete len:515 (+) Transcript_3601:438-1982(+)
MPAPGLEQLAAVPHPLQPRRVRRDPRAVAVRRCLHGAADGGLVLREGGVGVAADVRRAVLEVVEARDSEVHVELAAAAASGVWRASVLLHDNDQPVRVVRLRGLHEQTLPAAPASAVVGPAVVDVWAQDPGDRVRGRTRHPDVLAVDGAPVVVRVHGRILGRGHVLGLVPGLEEGRVAALPAAVPVVRALHPTLPLLGHIFVVVPRMQRQAAALRCRGGREWRRRAWARPGLWLGPRLGSRSGLLRPVVNHVLRDDHVAKPIIRGGRPAVGLARVLHEALVGRVLAAGQVDAVLVVLSAVRRCVVDDVARPELALVAAGKASGEERVPLVALRARIPAAASVAAVLLGHAAYPLSHRLARWLLRCLHAGAVLEDQATHHLHIIPHQTHEDLIWILRVLALVLNVQLFDDVGVREQRADPARAGLPCAAGVALDEGTIGIGNTSLRETGLQHRHGGPMMSEMDRRPISPSIVHAHGGASRGRAPQNPLRGHALLLRAALGYPPTAPRWAAPEIFF